MMPLERYCLIITSCTWAYCPAIDQQDSNSHPCPATIVCPAGYIHRSIQQCPADSTWQVNNYLGRTINAQRQAWSCPMWKFMPWPRQNSTFCEAMKGLRDESHTRATTVTFCILTPKFKPLLLSGNCLKHEKYIFKNINLGCNMFKHLLESKQSNRNPKYFGLFFHK